MAATLDVPSRFVINRLPRDDDELWWCVKALWGYTIPRTKVCPDHVAPFTAFANAYFARDPLSMWLASRGLGGKSRTLALLGLTETVLLQSEVSILGGSGAQSLNVHAATQAAWSWHNAPKHLLAKEPTKFDTVLNNGGSLRSLMASQGSVRGPHPSRLRMDEIDVMDQDILDAALGQPMVQTNQRGEKIPIQTTMSSTHQVPDGVVTNMLKRAKDAGFPVFRWCYKESSNPVDGWLSQTSIDMQKSVIPEAMWRTEFELQEPSFEGRAIDTAMVDLCFDPNLGETTGDVPYWTKPEQDHRYVTAIDWAKKQDMTVIATFDTSQTPWICVAWQKMNRLPWPVMVKKAIDHWREYGGNLIHDATGVGDVVDDIIRSEVTVREQAMVTPYIFSSGRDRSALFAEYSSAIEKQEIKYPRIRYAYDEHRYCTSDDLYGGGHPPDSIIAGALAWRMRVKKTFVVSPVSGSRGESPWI